MTISPADAKSPPAWIILFAAIILFAQCFQVPIGPAGPGVDASYPHILNLGAAAGARFGTDIVYTFGPLGYLAATEDVGRNLAISIAFWALVYGAFSILLAHFVVARSRGLWMITMTGLAAVAVTFLPPDKILICLVMALLLVGFDQPRWRNYAIGLAAAVAGIGLLIKMTIGVSCLGSIGLSLLCPLLPLRSTLQRVAVAAAAFGFAALAGWYSVAGDLSGIGAYLLNSASISGSYSSAMAIARPKETGLLITLAMSIGALLTFMSLLPRAIRLHALAVAIFPLLVAWKHGIVRFDGGHVGSIVAIVVFLTFCAALLHRSQRYSPIDDSPRASVIGSVVTIALLVLAIIKGAFLAETSFSSGLLSGYRTALKLTDMAGLRQNFREQETARFVKLRLPPAVLSIVGDSPTDLYSSDLALVAANLQVNWRLKPVFQHFNAFNDDLDLLNARFLASPKRPQFIMLYDAPQTAGMIGIDYRHQRFDDPIAFMQILRSYRLAYVERNLANPPVIILALQDESSVGAARSSLPFDLHWHQPLTVPGAPSSIVRLRFALATSLAGKVRSEAVRPGAVHIVYRLADGSEIKYRLMPGHTDSGVIVSPLMTSFEQFAGFLGDGKWSGPRVASVRIEPEDPADYTEPVRATWETVPCKAPLECSPDHFSVYARASDGKTRTPVQMADPLTTTIDVEPGPIRSAEVRLSTYLRENRGTVTLEVSDSGGNILGSSSINAATIKDNSYNKFDFPGLTIGESATVFRLSYLHEPGSAIATWTSSPGSSDFDLNLFR